MIIVDVETTGPDYKKHSIVSIGAIDFFNSANQFYQECRIYDNAEIVEEALIINGFSEKEIRNKNKKSLEQTLTDFLVWTDSCDDKTLAGENPYFDVGFLRASAEKYNIQWPLGMGAVNRTIDLHSLCYGHYLKRKLNPPVKNGRTDLNADKIFNYIGLPDEPKPHNALMGAKMEAEAFSRLIYGKPLFKEFENQPIPNYLLR